MNTLADRRANDLHRCKECGDQLPENDPNETCEECAEEPAEVLA